MSLTIKSNNPNYVAKIVSIPAPRPHPNADRLQLVTIDFQTVITGLDAQEGDIYVYFPLESKINSSFLKFTNSFSDKELNHNPEKAGFFNKHGRVRATRLRGTLSEGYIHPIQSINEWMESEGINYTFTEKDIGKEFDHIGETKFVEKYTPPRSSSGEGSSSKKGQNKIQKISRLIDHQFNFHTNTAQLKRQMGHIDPLDWISISYKLHGTSVVMSRILCKKPLNIFERSLKYLGVNVVDTHYDLIYSSRAVIKNGWLNKPVDNHWYGDDIWGLMAKKYGYALMEGISIYGEIVGQLPNGKWIQKNYDYGQPPNTAELYVYRITYTNPTGKVFEFNSHQIDQYCEKQGLKRVPVLYLGYAKDKYPDLSTGEHWHENFLAKLIEDYNEKDCFMCKNKVPEEGVVLRKENTDEFKAYKLKSNRFYLMESKELDSGEENMEESQTNEEQS